MLRPLFALSAVALTCSAAAAATYSAKPVVPTNERFIARDIVWTCGPAACQGATDESRPAVLCQALAKRAGRIESFVVDGRAFGPTELDKCNSAAKAVPAPALAAQ
ncbi:MAG TPA: hypothetical protein VJM15_02285 [Sphingomicrobium sp.]|nr:hypothetical protein [Sphingomicrobium sp.]